jgi:hypothetical protein
MKNKVVEVAFFLKKKKKKKMKFVKIHCGKEVFFFFFFG